MTKQTRLFVACIVALVAVAFGFVIRAFLLNEWGVLFNLSETQKGSIQGAGLYPQALSIIFFSLIIDRFGYGRTIAFALCAHVVSAIITVTATGYTGLYLGTFVFALAAGAVEAAINPITATLFSKSKTQHLNILHAGWPGGLVLGGVLAIAVGTSGGESSWRWKVALYLIPTVVYGVMLLATTEVGTDSWIAALMTPVLKDFGSNAGNWVLIYTSSIMFVLRFFAGPIAHRLSPLGLLMVCAAVAATGLYWLAHAGAAPIMVFLAATCYGFGKTFFWPTTLGVVSEQFPKGGVLTLDAIAGIGMISVGVLGNPLLGAIQDHFLDKTLAKQNPALHVKVAGVPQSKFGLTYQPLDHAKVAVLPETEQAEVARVQTANNQSTLAKVAVLPVIMFLCYLGLLLHFKSRGGYRPVQMDTAV